MEREGVEKAGGCGNDEPSSRDGDPGGKTEILKNEGAEMKMEEKSKAPDAKPASGGPTSRPPVPYKQELSWNPFSIIVGAQWPVESQKSADLRSFC
jgi:hypothetical protein